MHLSRRAGEEFRPSFIKKCNTLGTQRNAEMAAMRFDCVVVDEAAQVREPVN
jgi:superfamily I DNA and/or RNA helicase